MKILFNGWETWITTTGSDIKIGDGSKKTFKTVMAMWCEDTLHNLKKGGSHDDEESWVFEGGYSSDMGCSRLCLDWQSGKLRKNTSGHGENRNIEIEEEKEEDGDDSDGDYQKSPPLFVVAKAGDSVMKSAGVVESPEKNTRKWMSNLPTANSPTMATRGKRGQK
jgi:hypothetical protein